MYVSYARDRAHLQTKRKSILARSAWATLAILVACSSLVAVNLKPAAHAAGTYELISGGTTGQPNYSSNTAQVSANGRYVLFRSKATNILPGDTNSVADQFLYDRQTGATTLVSTNANGDIANGNSFEAALSADGRHAAFDTKADNLGGAVTFNHDKVYYRNLDTGETMLVAQEADVADISADGRYVAYIDRPYGGPPPYYVHIFDTVTQTSVVASADSNGTPFGVDSGAAHISDDGRLVTFATNVTPEDYQQGIVTGYLKDMTTGALTKISPDGVTAWDYNLSGNGRYVSFSTVISLTPDANGNVYYNLFRKDLISNTTETIAGSVPDAPFTNITPDGRYVGFVPGQGNDRHIELWDSTTHTMEIVCSSALNGLPCEMTSPKAISADGGVVAFYTLDEHGTPTDMQVYAYSRATDTIPPTIDTATWSVNPKPVGTVQNPINSTLTVAAADNVNVTGGEYFIGTDPGQGNGTAMPYSSGNLTASLGAGFATGVYDIGIRSRDAAGNWSAVSKTTLVVYDPALQGVTGKNKKDLVPVFNSDVLPGLVAAGQTDEADYGFTVDWKNGVLDPANDFHFTYETGKCNGAHPQNCHTFTLNATSFTWLAIDQTNNSRARFQGLATVIVDGTTTTNPFTVEGIDGNRLTPVVDDQFMLKIFSPGADPATATPLYHVTAALDKNNAVTIR